LGSELVFYRIVRKLGKRATIINKDDIPYGYDFLPGRKVIRIESGRKTLQGIRFDCLVALDCSDLNRPGWVHKVDIRSKPILNIDHHISNQRFGDINWVDPTASSCSEMIYRLHKALGLPFDRDTALLLYVGMLTDTGSFRYSNTKSLTHKAVSELLQLKLNVAEIYKNIYGNIPFQDMLLLTKILSGLRRDTGGRIIWAQISKNLLKNKELSFDLSEQILSFARAIKGAEVCVLFKENLGVKGEVRVNFRSQGKVDVNKIASCFGGGGHKTASGATVKGKIDQVGKRVLAKIRQSLRK